MEALQQDTDAVEFFHRGGKTVVLGHPEMEKLVTQEVALEYVYGAVYARAAERMRTTLRVHVRVACKCMQ